MSFTATGDSRPELGGRAEVDGGHPAGTEPAEDPVTADHPGVGAEQRIHVRQSHPASLARSAPVCKDSLLLIDLLWIERPGRRRARRSRQTEPRRDRCTQVMLHLGGFPVGVDDHEPVRLGQRSVGGVGRSQIVQVLVVGATSLDPGVGASRAPPRGTR